VQGECGLAQEGHRVPEADHLAVAHRGGRPDPTLRDVPVGDRRREVATGHDRLGTGRPITGRSGGSHPVRRRGQPPVGTGLLGGLLQSARTDPGHPGRHGQLREAPIGLGRGHVGVLRDHPGGPGSDVHPSRRSGPEVGRHVDERGDPGDGAGTEREAVGDRPDQLAVRAVHRRTGHALPDPADPVDLRRRQPDHDHVEVRGDPVVDDPQHLAGEPLRCRARADAGHGEPRDRVALDDADRDPCGAVARGLRGLRRCRHNGSSAEAQSHRGGQ
jgi:hypothetical protein